MIADAASKNALLVFPYFRVMCWGHGEETFQFRHLAPGEVSALQTLVLKTKQGPEIETALMSVVTTLMAAMQHQGISAADFEQLKVMLADEDKCLDALRQIALTRRFDLKQATEVVRLVGIASPFDKVEAAVLLYDALLNKASFHNVLNEFPDVPDRENVCHRLGLITGPDGVTLIQQKIRK